jgi:phosphotransferase system HPr (HPr) family protein
MQRIRLIVNHPVGLHARPAAQFVQTASQFQSAITVANVNDNAKPVDAKSILNILTLGVNQGTEIEISAQGPDEQEAIEALKALVESNFGE